MFEGQPKGLYGLALANTGERFGYYTMLAIFTLYLQAKFGYTAGETSVIFSSFLAFVYFLPVVGGYLADKYGFGNLVKLGFIVMFLGYVLLAIPSDNVQGKWMMFAALGLISLGTGFFKGNLQVMVGNLYDTPALQSKRDTAFSIFYMAINIGAMFAPTAATKMTDWMLAKYGFTYQSNIPALAHQYLDGSISGDNLARLQSLMDGQHYEGTIQNFCNEYIMRLSEAYNYGFGVACISLIISVLIYFAFRPTFKHVEQSTAAPAPTNKSNEKKVAQEPTLTKEETTERIVTLLIVFSVVIFFWMSFHQNGLTLTFFARDYTNLHVTGLTRLGFDIVNLALLVVVVYAGFAIFSSKKKLIPILVTVAALTGVYFNYGNAPETVVALPQTFQQFNPFFVVALTPFSLALFSTLAKKGKEPSAPRKIALGMLVAACGFLILSINSIGLPTPDALAADFDLLKQPVSPNVLISTYLVLTFAELLLSPMGISFVSKVAPPKYKGLMMGGWFAATAIGNYAVAIIGLLWGGMQLWMLWGILITLCVLSALFMFAMMKRLESIE